jgi:hypothetical protein
VMNWRRGSFDDVWSEVAGLMAVHDNAAKCRDQQRRERVFKSVRHRTL